MAPKKKTKKKTNGGEAPLTTGQALGSLIKTARDIMRKDKGLNGDLDRLPLLTWIMFLKFLDDLELQREEEAQLGRKKFRPAIETPYRWRDWAANPQGITGDELLTFINQDETRLPGGKRGPGLFAYLRGLSSAGGDDRREVIATVFRGVDNRMKSGYLLRDVINKVAGIHFTSSEELHTLGALYESMLREMRDAAGDSGEFYTPRPVVRFMVEVTDPQLGETILDPASGTGGFLVEAFNHLSKEVKTVADRKRLQSASIFGCEPKSLPYLLGQMNLLLHGLDAPQIDPSNSLRFKLSEIGEKDRVDVILTNPPFGGEEEKGIQGNFPEDRQTAETALLFLQLIMRKLHRQPTGVGRPARAAVVVPNGILYGDGICGRIKEELLKEFNLHTIIRLPSGVFSPYTPIPTNILFFDRSGPTKAVWYYEVPLPEGRKKYLKTLPIQFDDFQNCLTWWNDRKETSQAWVASAEQLLAAGCNLDQKNPRGSPDLIHTAPERIAVDIIDYDRALSSMLENLTSSATAILADAAPMNGSDRAPGGHQPTWPRMRLDECIRLVEDAHTVQHDKQYPNFGIYSFGRGLFQKQPIDGALTSATTLFRVKCGQFIYSRLFAFEGAYGTVTSEFDGHYVSAEYPTFECDPKYIRADFLSAVFQSPDIWKKAAQGSKGLGDRRQRVKPEQLLAFEMPMPPLEWQAAFVSLFEKIASAKRHQEEITRGLEAFLPAVLQRAFSDGR
jgi:type I restriction enzyme M protein